MNFGDIIPIKEFIQQATAEASESNVAENPESGQSSTKKSPVIQKNKTEKPDAIMIDLDSQSEEEGSDIEIIEQPACQPLELKCFFKFNDKSLIHEKFDN